MIVEHEIIEQVEHEPRGRSLAWCVGLAGRLGRPDGLVLIEGMWRAGHVALAEPGGEVLPRWRAEEAWREGATGEELMVLATESGSRWVHG